VVIDDLGTLLRRFPRLSDCKFAGGRGFADDLTRVWIQASVLVGGANQDESPVSAAADTGLREAGREAKTLAAKGKFKDAVDVLREGRKQAGSGRERFLWDLQQATFWQETGHLEIAVAQLESLDEEAQLHRLEQWEPELSVQIAALLLVCYTNMENNGALTPERVAHKERVQSRLSRLDSARAMDLIKKT
jgi:type VI secretion system protein VasJ